MARQEEQMHDGHRKRLRARFLSQGLDGFDPHNVLELLLFHVIHRKDTNELAHRLIDRFGSLAGVLEAPVEELQKVDGIGETAAFFMHLIPHLSRYYLNDKYSAKMIVDSSQSAGNYLMNKFIGRKNETVFLLLLDVKGKMLFCDMVGEGSFNQIDINMRKIVEAAMRYNAYSAILAHNHPSGVALPSKNDIDTTYKVQESLQLVGVKLVDHIIVADRDFVSLAESGLMDRDLGLSGK